MNNLVFGVESRDFWVWVDPRDRMARHNITLTGAFVSTPVEPFAATLMFLPNPAFKTFISPFQNNLLRNYAAEYNLELTRAADFPDYPSRLHAIFLLDSLGEAEAYYSSHFDHVSGRILRKVQPVGPHTYSVHDSCWVDFLRIGGALDSPTTRAVTGAYWSGESVSDCKLEAFGRPWTSGRVTEVLFLGRVDFIDRELDV